MAKPSIIFVPGSYSLLSAYQPLFDAVSKAGYEIIGARLPTIGQSSREGGPGPAPAMYDDATAIAEETERLADQGKDVILMGHSYAGVPMSQSTKGLSKTERLSEGKQGGVVQLAFIACLVPPVGGSAGSLLSRFPEENKPPVSIDENGWMLITDPLKTASLICQDLPSKEGEAFVRDFAKHSARSFGDELTHAGYKDISTSYLLCEDDMAGPPDFQREMITMIEEVSGKKVDVTTVRAGHCPNMSAEKETLEWIFKVIHRTQEH